MVTELRITRQRGGNHHPLSVRGFTNSDGQLTELVKGIQSFLKQRSQFKTYEGQLAAAIKGMGADIVKWPGSGITFPDYIARGWGHTCGAIDIYAEFNGKRAGIEFEEHGWYQACVPELLKLGWSDLDYRIIAWQVGRLSTMERLSEVKMLPFPNPVLVITQFRTMEVSSGD